MTERTKVKSPFMDVPSGMDIAQYFLFETKRRNNGAEGIDLWWDKEKGYCYLWVEVHIDFDMQHYFLLDVRTNLTEGEAGETRDYLFVKVDVFSGISEVEWFNKPLPFNSEFEEHRKRWDLAMQWMLNRVWPE